MNNYLITKNHKINKIDISTLSFITFSFMIMLYGKLNNDYFISLGGIWIMLVPSVLIFFNGGTKK